MDGHFREQHLGLIGRNSRVNDNIITLVPVHRCSYSVLVTELQRVDDAQNLVEVAAGGSRVGNRESDDLLGVDHEDCANRERKTLCVTVGSILFIKHVIKRRNFPLFIGDDRELDVGWTKLSTVFVDVPDPAVVILKIVSRDSDDLDIPLCEIICTTGDLAEFGGADRSKVARVREQDNP